VDQALTKMKIDADLHNFGQHVTQIERASEIYFQKPRPIYWEWFFFGNNSPIKNIFEPKIAEVLFNLDVHFDNGDCGFSKQVIESSEDHDKDAHAYNLGILIAYSYIFGIRDLHEGNLIKKSAYLQVIDAEVVFSKILLPNETLLLPFKITTAEDCGAKKSFDNINEIDLQSMKLILTGYFDLFLNILEKRDQLLAVINQHREKMLTIPVRHIMRDTIQYRKWLEEKLIPAIPFCRDELKQLERGDIPYYFKLIGQPELYSYTGPTGDYEAVSAPDEYSKGINRDATDPLELLMASRTDNELLPNGALFLLKKLAPKGYVGVIESKNFMAEIVPEKLIIHFDGKSFSTKA
jgi:hypothetical protein